MSATRPSIVEPPYQHEAIRRVGEAFAARRRRALLVMATGTGETQALVRRVRGSAPSVAMEQFEAIRRDLIALRDSHHNGTLKILSTTGGVRRADPRMGGSPVEEMGVGTEMPDEPTANKEELLKTLDDIESRSASVQEQAAKASEDAALAKDLASTLRPAVARLKDDSALSPPAWAVLRRSWALVAHDLERAERGFSLFGPGVSVSANATAAVTTSTLVYGELQFAQFQPFADRLTAHLQRRPLVVRAEAALRTFGLDEPRGSDRSPVQLLHEASQSIDRPTSEGESPIALIALREAIQAALARLLQMRPAQETANRTKEKISSIGRQCGRSELEGAHFEQLGEAIHLLLSELSLAKQRAMARTEIQAAFDRGVMVLTTLLNALDPDKLRR